MWRTKISANVRCQKLRIDTSIIVNLLKSDNSLEALCKGMDNILILFEGDADVEV